MVNRSGSRHSAPPAVLPKFAIITIIPLMATMNISLPDALRDFVDDQVSERGFGTSSEYVRELIRKEQDRLRLRRVLLDGAESAPGPVADGAYFDALRARIHGHDAQR